MNFITSQILAQREIENVKDIEPDSTPTVLGFVRAEATEAPATVIANPEEIEIEDSDDEANGNEQNADIDIANQVIPKAVFGVLASQMLDEKVGAKDRFKRKRADAEKELE